jgi:hypothetical protein
MPQVWTNKDTLFDKLVVIAEDAVFSADMEESALQECKHRIDSGEPPLNVLGEKATMIPYFSITRVKVDEHDSDIDLDYKAGKESKNKTLAFTDIETRKLAFAEIQARLGDKFTCMTETYNVMRAVYAPLMTFTVVALVTWLLHGAAAAIAGGEEADFSGRHSGMKRLFYWILELLGPTGVLVLGGLFMLLAVMSLVKRAKQPPVITTLKEGQQHPGGIVGTVVRYGILAGMWYLFAPGIFAAVTSL